MSRATQAELLEQRIAENAAAQEIDLPTWIFERVQVSAGRSGAGVVLRHRRADTADARSRWRFRPRGGGGYLQSCTRYADGEGWFAE